MTGAENYKEFDTASIVSRDTVSVGKLTFRKREAILALIALIALIAVIILAIVLAVEVGGRSCSSPMAANTDMIKSDENYGSGDQSCENLCTTPQCLRAASYEKSIMNDTVNPCVDFYQFACGNYAEEHSPTPYIPAYTPFNAISDENVGKLIEVISFPAERTQQESYERKLRHFMASCTDHFDKMQLRGKPLVDQVIRPFGGWYVLGKWNASEFNLHAQLKKVHIDFWTQAFFTISLSTDTTDWNKRVLQLDSGGLGLPSYAYNTNKYSLVSLLYTNYIINIATMTALEAARDSYNSSLINQFAYDVVEVERKLAEVVESIKKQDNPHDAANRMSLDALNKLTNNTLDLVDYFNTAFPFEPKMFTGDTTVAVLKEGFFHSLGPMINGYLATDSGKRKLHNYLVWQLLNRYSRDLSWDYVHQKRQLNYYLFGQKDDTSGYSYCFRVAERTMREAMGAVFVKNYVNQKDRQAAMEMLEQIKEQMITGISTLSWMTSDNKVAATNKIKDSLYKIGYPDFMVDEKYMDALYENVDINEQDFFGNILRLNDVSKKQFKDLLAKPDSKTLWVYHVMDPAVAYRNPWHELIATQAVFQKPLFAHNGPLYYNYGGVGTLLGKNLIHAIDEIGSQYKMDKSNLGDWWTDLTRQRYQEIKDCSINAQSDKQLGPFITNSSNPNPLIIKGSDVSRAFAPELLAEASGLSLSYKAYKAKMKKGGQEKIPAGFSGYSSEKMFFIAYAQTNCENTPDLLKVSYLNDNKFPGDYRVNMAVSQLSEFRDAFKCKLGDPMAPQKTCALF